jgi:hypothetical protein
MARTAVITAERALICALFFAGCGFDRVGAAEDLASLSEDLSGFDLAALDLGGADFAAVDLAGGDLARSPDASIPACPRPHLLVAVEDFSAAQHGFVARVALDVSGQPTLCAPLTGQGLLPQQPFAVTLLGVNRVAIAARDAVVLLDSDSDSILWSQPNPTESATTMEPVDVFPLRDPTSLETMAAVAFKSAGSLSGDIKRIVVRDSGGTIAKDWTMADLGLASSGVLSIAGHATAPTHFLAFVSGTYSARDVNPFASTQTTAASCCGTQTQMTIGTALFGGTQHAVWATRTSGGNAAAHYMEDLAGGGLPSGPASCGQLKCDGLHAVPDPTQTRGILLLCDAATTSGRKVVRFDSFGSFCETVLDGVTVPDGRLARLGIVP